MAFLFDTDAISELLKRRPAPAYARWVAGIPREEQFTSAVCIGELYRGAYGSLESSRHLEDIASRVLPAVTVLPYDTEVAKIYGRIHAAQSRAGRGLADADLQIAATALHHGLGLVTGNLRHFRAHPRAPARAIARGRSTVASVRPITSGGDRVTAGA